MAARSFHIRLVNATGGPLTRNSFGLSHGVWSSNNSAVPPAQILPGHAGNWQSESNGVATGTEGTADYSASNGVINIHWDDPYFGSNSLDVAVPAGIQQSHGDISGNDAAVEIILTGGIIDD